MGNRRERRYSDLLKSTGVRHPVAAVVATALALLSCASFGIWLRLPGADPPRHEGTVVALMSLSCLVLLGRRTYPRTAVIVATACTGVTLALGYLLTPLLLAPLMAALYWLTTHTDRRTARNFGILSLAALTLVAAVTEQADLGELLIQTVGPFCWLMLPLIAGNMTRLRHAYVQAVQGRAEHAEKTREEEARLRVSQERMRIARELHDVLAHHMALANAQAGTAAHLVLTDPEKTRKMLTDLTGTTSSALRELKLTLGLLRQDDATVGPSPLAPLPGLSQLPELVSTCASAGLNVVVTQEGEAQPLTTGADLTAYRIIQEALTNVTKHATADSAHIHLRYIDSRVLITIANDEPIGPRPAQGHGFGLLGMHERAAAVGGELSASPRPHGGFEVTTALPLQMPSLIHQEESSA
ncbi:sensor histidine kinase [Streptomyces microflavus]|uniref:sensor histidine kinase n=1 Tax=Streptomyces microflavus TaxID=1919 RepID=UPI00364B2F2F